MGTNVPTMETVPPYRKTRLTNCKNCGAVLKGNVCEYCGTEYGNATPTVLKVRPRSMEELRDLKRELEKANLDSPVILLPDTTTEVKRDSHAWLYANGVRVDKM